VKAAIRCVGCSRKLRELDLLLVATAVFDRKCAGCGVSWRIVATPLANAATQVVHRLDWTAKNFRAVATFSQGGAPADKPATAHCNEREIGCLDALASTCSCDCVPCHEAELGAVKS